MHMHYAPTQKRLDRRDPMCGYVGTNDEICTNPDLCTCPECLDWIRPDHHWSMSKIEPVGKKGDST